MAGELTIGKLLVQMALDDKEYRAALTDAADATSEAAQAIGKSTKAGVSDASKGLEDLGAAGAKAGAAVKGTAEDMEKAAGLFRDVNGKLRDATGKFVTDAEALARLRSGLSLTTEELKILQEQADKINLKRLTEMGSELNDTLTDVTETLRGYIVTAFEAATIAAGGLATAATIVGSNFQQKMTTVGVIADATKEQIGALSAKARELGATTSFSASEAADAMQLLAGAGLSVSQVMTATGDALTLAGAGGTSLEQAAATLSSTMAQFGLEAAQAARISDVLSKATAASQFTVEDLSEALKYGGTVGAGFGWSLEQTVATLAQFRDLGMQGSQAGTALRSAMIGATNASTTNVAALKKYGLTLADINPETHTFAEILTNVGKAGVSTTDSLIIFGAEAGAAVATLSKQFAAGSDSYGKMLSDLENASGTASAMYADMQKNVAGGFANLQSAAEEVLLTLFDQYSGPLADLLMSITNVVNRIAQEINSRSTFIRASLKDAFMGVTEWLDQNADYIAESIAGFMEGAAAFATNVRSILPILSELLPLLDDIALTMGLIWITGEVMAFVAAATEVVSAVTAVGWSLQGLMVVMTEATGGIYALVAGIGILVAGLVALIARYNDASDAAEKLKAAQDKLKQGEVTATAARVAALQGYIDTNKEALKQEAMALAASGQSSSARYKEIQTILNMTGATAAQAEAEGKLVLIRGQLRTVGSIAEDMNPEDVAAFRQEVVNLSNESAKAGKTVTALEQAMIKARTVNTNVPGAEALIAVYLRAADATVSTLTEAEARVGQLRNQQKQTADAAIALNGEYEKSTTAMLDQESRKQKQGAQNAVATKAGETADKIRLEKDYADQTSTIAAQLQRDLARIGATDVQQAALDLKDKQQQIIDQYAKQENAARTYYQGEITAQKGNLAAQKKLQDEYNAELLRLEEQKQSDLGLLYALSIKEQSQKQMEEEKKRSNDRIAEEKRLADIIYGLEEAGMSESEKLAHEKAATLAGIDDSYGAQKAQIAAYYDKQIMDADAKVAQEAKKSAKEITDAWSLSRAAADFAAKEVSAAWDYVKAAIDRVSGSAKEMLMSWPLMAKGVAIVKGAIDDVKSAIDAAKEKGGEFVENIQARFPKATQAVSDISKALKGTLAVVGATTVAVVAGLLAGVSKTVDAIGNIAGALKSAASMASGFVDFFASGLESLTGFSFSLRDAIAGVVSIMQEAKDSATSITMPGGTTTTAASPTANVGIAATSFINDSIQAGLDFVQAASNAVPLLLNALVAGLPTLIDALVSAIPTVISALSVAIPALISVFVQAVPQVVQALADGVPVLVQALVNGLPAIVDMLVGLINSDIIGTLIDGVFALIQAAVANVPTLIIAIIEKIPSIVQGLLAKLPMLITGLIGGIGQVIVALIDAIPEIVQNLITALPGIIIALIDSVMAAIPTIVLAVVDAVPKVIASVISGIPRIFSSILSRLPSIITTLIGMIPSLILALVQALPAMIPAIVQIIPQLITSLVTFMPDIVVAFVKALVIELPKQLWQMVPAMGQALVAAIKGAWDGLIDAIGGLFKAAWDAITSIFNKDKDSGSAYSGIAYVPATMRMTVHEGEAVVPASRNARRGNGIDMAQAGGRVNPGAFSGGGGEAAQPLQVLVNGRVVEEVLIQSGRNGHATKLKQIMRSTSGVKAGLDRGHYNRYNR